MRNGLGILKPSCVTKKEKCFLIYCEGQGTGGQSCFVLTVKAPFSWHKWKSLQACLEQPALGSFSAGARKRANKTMYQLQKAKPAGLAQ